MTGIDEALLAHDAPAIRGVILLAKRQGIPAEKARDALICAMDSARCGLSGKRISLPEFLLVIDTFRAGAKQLRISYPGMRSPKGTTKIAIGVVEGDVHDMGKNIVAAVLEARGYPVIDMGREVGLRAIQAVIQRDKPAVIALSSMMSTCLDTMKDIIRGVKSAHPRVMIIVGGAALDGDMALVMGADGYADSAITAPDEIRRLLGAQ